MTPSQLEAAHRLQRAMGHLQNARKELDKACELISSVRGALLEWRAIGKISDSARKVWYKLEEKVERGKIDLDGHSGGRKGQGSIRSLP